MLHAFAQGRQQQRETEIEEGFRAERPGRTVDGRAIDGAEPDLDEEKINADDPEVRPCAVGEEVRKTA